MSDNQNYGLIERLFKSFQELESAIHGARTNLEKKSSVPAHVFQRLDSYDEILKKQRSLALTLGDYARKGDTAQVARFVKIINGLSGMIIEDARSILSSLNDTPTLQLEDSSEDDLNIC